MNKKTKARIASIQRDVRFIKPQERGTSEEIERLLGEGFSVDLIAVKLGVNLGYVTSVRDTIERRA